VQGCSRRLELWRPFLRQAGGPCRVAVEGGEVAESMEKQGSVEQGGGACVVGGDFFYLDFKFS
jgi:hypothetical protein